MMLSKNELDRRFSHHPPRDAVAVESHEGVREAFRLVAEAIDVLCPDGREKACAITAIEEAMFWANAGIARA